MERKLTLVARKLRRNATDVEADLWQHLRGRQIEGVKFRRQFAIGPYVADFCSPEIRLVIELDGGQHAQSATDAARTTLTEANGYTVLRFWNNDVTENIEGVLEEIRLAILNARPR